MTIPPALQAVALAVLLSPVFLAAHVLLFRRKKADTPGFYHLFMAFVIYIAAWAITALLIWGRGSGADRWLAGLSTAGFICLAHMQVFSQFCRGFSLRIVVDIERCNGLDVEGVMREYADGRGVGWLLDKRIESMKGLGLLSRTSEGGLRAHPRGRRFGQIGILLKRIIKPGQGG